jgi:homoserine/homoserine lactone efflux protein
MTIETWLAFVVASTILVVIPGPTMLLVVSYALGQGAGAPPCRWRSVVPV